MRVVVEENRATREDIDWDLVAINAPVVEDETKTGDYLKLGLSEAGFVVDLARDGVDGLHLAVNGEHELIILDVMLPGLDGREHSRL